MTPCISEDGGSLSQGQKQLLCITRVMLCLPPMLILDEATSSIDTRTELHIQEAFARLMQGRTSFIVAHRLSTIRKADIILVMKDGAHHRAGQSRAAARGGTASTPTSTTASLPAKPRKCQTALRFFFRKRSAVLLCFYLLEPRKNSATVPGPECAPMTGST